MSLLENLEVPSAGVLAEAVFLVPHELQRALLSQGPHAIDTQDMNEVVCDIIARYPLVVESPRQSPGPGKSFPKRRAPRQYLSRFDVLDVGKDDRPEIHGKSAKAGVQVVHLAPICTAMRGWVVTTALRRWAKSFLGRSDVT